MGVLGTARMSESIRGSVAMSICLEDSAVFYSHGDGEAAVRRQPDFILQPPLPPPTPPSLPDCSMWAINLSPAIPKQSSNQWEMMSAIDGPAFLFLPLAASPDVLSVAVLPLFSSSSSFSQSCSPPPPPPPPALLPAPEMRQLSSSSLLTEAAFTHSQNQPPS